MTPIYATERANLSGWYAFKEPRGQYSIWDGCGKFGMQTGFWCPFTGNIVDCNDSMPDNMPSIPAAGYLNGDEFCVLGFPDAEDVLPTLGGDPDIIMDFIDRPGIQIQASMYDEIMDEARVLEGTSAYYVAWVPLPPPPAPRPPGPPGGWATMHGVGSRGHGGPLSVRFTMGLTLNLSTSFRAGCVRW